MKKESDPNRAFYNTNLSMITTFHRLTNSRSRFLTVYGYIYCLYKLVPDITSVITAINAHLKLIYRIKLVSAVLKTKKKKNHNKRKNAAHHATKKIEHPLFQRLSCGGKHPDTGDSFCTSHTTLSSQNAFSNNNMLFTCLLLNNYSAVHVPVNELLLI